MRLTETHLRKFESYVRKWQGKLGLQDWELSVVWLKEETAAENDFRAAVHITANGGIATVCLARDWPGYDSVSSRDIEFVAFHELCHVLLSKMLRVAEMFPTLTGGVREMEEHAVIRKLEYLILGADPV